jgi:hypothetical protein
MGTKVVKVTAASAAVVEAISPVTTPTIDSAEVRLSFIISPVSPGSLRMKVGFVSGFPLAKKQFASIDTAMLSWLNAPPKRAWTISTPMIRV